MTWPDLTPYGPFFDLRRGAGDGLRPLSDLGADATPLRTRVAATHARLSAEDPSLPERVAASTVQLALTARLVSPALAGAALAGTVPDLSASRVRWPATDTEAAPFAVPDLEVREVTGVADATRAIDKLVLHGSVLALVEATLEGVGVGVAEQILWGNVASALAGAASVLGSVTGPTRADAGERCRRIVSRLLDTPRLSGTGSYQGQNFRRTTCCLYYRAPGGGLCGDCVLARGGAS